MEKEKKNKNKIVDTLTDDHFDSLHTLAILELQNAPCTKYILPEGNDLVVCDSCDCDRDAAAEHTTTTDTEWLESMTGPPGNVSDIPLALVNSSAIDDTVIDPQEYDDARTFGPSRAPWVGAENLWREGRVPPPPAAPLRTSVAIPKAAATTSENKDIFTTDELAAVISTTPAPRAKDTSRRGRALAVLRTAAVAMLGAVVSWAIFMYTQSSNNESDRAAASTMTQAAFLAPPAISTKPAAQPASLVEWAPEEPAVMVFEEEDVTPVTKEKRRSVPPVATTAIEVTSRNTPAVAANEAEKVVTAEEAAEPTGDAPTVTMAFPHDPETAVPPDVAPGGEEIEDQQEEAQAPAAPASDVETPTPSPEEKNLEKETSEDPMAAVLMRTKTKTPEARIYKDDLSVMLGGTPGDPATSAAAKPFSPAVVRQTLSSIAPRIKRCSNGKSGRIVMDIVISGSTGRVLDATPKTREFQGTPTGICASRTLKLAKFPRSELSRQHVEYAFELE